jgi:hypothetical protein
MDSNGFYPSRYTHHAQGSLSRGIVPDGNVDTALIWGQLIPGATSLEGQQGFRL